MANLDGSQNNWRGPRALMLGSCSATEPPACPQCVQCGQHLLACPSGCSLQDFSGQDDIRRSGMTQAVLRLVLVPGDPLAGTRTKEVRNRCPITQPYTDAFRPTTRTRYEKQRPRLSQGVALETWRLRAARLHRLCSFWRYPA